jgi:hypothetical protein
VAEVAEGLSFEEASAMRDSAAEAGAAAGAGAEVEGEGEGAEAFLPERRRAMVYKSEESRKKRSEGRKVKAFNPKGRECAESLRKKKKHKSLR